jgi:hypothetical protein
MYAWVITLLEYEYLRAENMKEKKRKEKNKLGLRETGYETVNRTELALVRNNWQSSTL